MACSEAGVIFADVRQEFDGHGCGSDNGEWINCIVAGAGDDEIAQSFHPDVEGNQAYTRVVTPTL